MSKEADEIQKLKDEIAAANARADQEKERADQEKERADRIQADVNRKETGQYWDTIDQVWEFVPAGYSGHFSSACELRKTYPCSLYEEEVVHILTDGRAVEAVLEDNDAPSVFERDDQTSVSSVSRGSESFERNRSNRTGDKNDEIAHARNMLGSKIRSGDKSRAYTFPADVDCSKWWWPMYLLVTGTKQPDYDVNAIKKLASMRTSKFIFAGEHNLIFDTLKDGIVCILRSSSL